MSNKEKYRLNWSFVKIGMDLHIHPNGLQRWRDKFLAEIASLLEYNLPSTDIFSRNKVEALIYVLERTITFHEKFGNFDEKVLAELKFKLEVYQNLLFDKGFAKRVVRFVQRFRWNETQRLYWTSRLHSPYGRNIQRR